jgi:hypothetical protein
VSWNVTLTDIAPEAVEQAAQDGYAAFRVEVFPEMDGQFEAALSAARMLLLLRDGTPLADIVGGGNVNVTLSGHANPGHKPREGWANDYVSVHVSSAVRALGPQADIDLNP